MFYGNLDGYSYCGDSYDFVIEPEVKPQWMSVEGSLVTIGHKTEIDPEDSIQLTVRVSKEGTE